MREPLDRPRLSRFLASLGDAATSPGRVYLTGGATAITYGWRDRTIDVDLKLDPEPAGVFAAIARLKDELALNIELASPSDFIPEVPGWRERSIFERKVGLVEVYHYDPVSQALAKLARGYARDLADVEAMVRRGLVSRVAVLDGFRVILPSLVRFPRIDAESFALRVEAFASEGASS